MKKVLLTVALVVATFVSASAQFWIGGAAGFNSNSIKDGEGDAMFSTSAFSISPEFGYSVNDKFSVGLTLGFGSEGYKPGNEDRISASSFAIAPFAQYKALEFGKFQLIGRATLGFESYKGYNLDEENGIAMDGDDNSKLTGFGVNVTPFLHYVISDKFNVFGAMNFLSLNFASVSAKYDGEKLGTVNVFNLGVDANNVANTGAFQIGFIYKF